MGLHYLLDLPGNPALQLSHISQTVFRHNLLTMRAFLPSSPRSLISTYMYIFGREQFHQFSYNILDEVKKILAARAHVRIHHPFTIFIHTGKFRIGLQHFPAMSRNLELRNYIYMTLSSIRHQFTHVILRIIAAGSHRTSLLGIKAPKFTPLFPSTADTPCRLFHKHRPGIYLDSPPCIIHQMKMKLVHLQQRHRIYLFLNKLPVTEVSRHIYHQTPVRKSRPVVNRAALQFVATRRHLPQRLQRIKSALRREGFYVNALLPYCQ